MNKAHLTGPPREIMRIYGKIPKLPYFIEEKNEKHTCSFAVCSQHDGVRDTSSPEKDARKQISSYSDTIAHLCKPYQLLVPTNLISNAILMLLRHYLNQVLMV
jgi:hypothetical protein